MVQLPLNSTRFISFLHQSKEKYTKFALVLPNFLKMKGSLEHDWWWHKHALHRFKEIKKLIQMYNMWKEWDRTINCHKNENSNHSCFIIISINPPIFYLSERITYTLIKLFTYANSTFFSLFTYRGIRFVKWRNF